MKNLSMMIKPASSNCNLRCKYCFYADISASRSQASYGVMDRDVMEALISRAIEEAEETLGFVFQGGEPTLAGLNYFRDFVDLVERKNAKKLKVSYGLQTNGVVIDEEWCHFLKRHDFLVGLSVDGTRDLHDRMRVDAKGMGTYDRIMRAAELFDQYHITYNVVTVVTRYTAKHISKIYEQYRKNGWDYLQFIPCLDPYEVRRGSNKYSLTPEIYGRFLSELFDLWYQDICRGKYVYIRYFENLMGILMRVPPESCSLFGGCRSQIVVEANGDCYPCDFYVYDERKMGNIMKDPVRDMLLSTSSLRFEKECQPLPEECIQCRWFGLCRGGCRRNRDYEGKLAVNYFCASYKAFFAYTSSRYADVIERYQL